MAVGDKKAVLMEGDKGSPNGVAGLDANGKVVGAVAKTGDTMTGALKIAAPGVSGGFRVSSSAEGASLVVQEDIDNNASDRTMLNITHGDEKDALLIRQIIDGVQKDFVVYHAGNLTELRDALKAIW